MIRRLAGPVCLAVLLIALTGCDDSSDLTGSTASPDEAGGDAHATSFSSKAIAGGDLQVQGMLTTTGETEGRVEFDVRSRTAEKKGRSKSPLLEALPDQVSFSGRTMTYTSPSGETRSVELSKRDAEMLKNALEARTKARTGPPPAIARSGTRSQAMPPQEMVKALREQGFEVEPLDGPRYRVTQPNPRGGAEITAVVNTETGTFERTVARHQDEPVAEVESPTAKSGGELPTVTRVEDEK